MPLQPFRPLGQVDPSLQGIGLVKNIQGARQNELLNLARQAELDEFALGAPVREAQRGAEIDAATLASIQQGAIEAFPFIQANDDEGLLNNIIRREQTILERRGDTSQTREIREMLQSGDQSQINQAKQIMTAIATQGQPAQAGFTLGQGQQRFGPQGQPIAAVAPTQAGFTLGQGQQRFGPQGQPIAAVAPAPTQAGVRERQIADALRLNPGLTEQQATKVVDKQASIEVNEKTGKLIFKDNVAGTVTELKLAGGEPQIPAPSPGETLFELAEVATGPVSSITAKGAAALSFFGIDPQQPSVSAQQVFRTEIQGLIRALSINPRFPVAEMERIKEEISVQPSFFQGTGILRQKMQGLDTSLRRRMAQADRDANDPNLDEETRQKQGANASAIRNFLPILGVPQEDQEDPIEARIRELEAQLGIN